MKHTFARMANLSQTMYRLLLRSVFQLTFTVRDFLQLPFTSEASEERQTRATGEGAFPRRACLTLHARLVLRSPEKCGKIGPVLLAMSLEDQG